MPYSNQGHENVLKKGSSECGPVVNVQGSQGANLNPTSFYSTHNSSTYVDWLPVLQSKFKLHLNTKTNIKSHRPELKQTAGYTKNTSIYVPYDPLVDEKDYP